MKYEFPKGFWWGSAASGPQTEGRLTDDGKGESIWDHWFNESPQSFFNEVGPEKTSQFLTKYKEDIQLMKQTGHNSFRLSIQWSRLIPNGTGKVNQKAVNFYNDVINELIANDIEPFVNLYHFDMPFSLQEKGGWLSRSTIDAYTNYAKISFELFGDRVKKWFTHNEPIVPVEGGYLYQFHYPNHVNMKEAVQVAYNEVIASASAIEIFKSMNLNGKIGVILNLTPSYPASSQPEDKIAANYADLFFNRSFLDPSVKGKFPEELVLTIKELNILPITEEGDLELIKKNTIDILGINYYQPRRIKEKKEKHRPKDALLPDNFFDYYDMPNKKMNPYRGWEIYEKGIYDILTNLRENYGNILCYISENGMGVEGEERFMDENGQINDDYRIEFVSNHLKYVHQAIQEGSNVQGYHMWTCMDNWSWTNAYKNRYGFISVDLDNDGQRSIKKSGYWFKELSKNNGFN